MPKALSLVFLCFVVLALPAVAWAAPLGLPQLLPDISSAFVTINYDATLEEFYASGFAVQYNGAPIDPLFAPFGLTADVDNAGVLSSGSVSIGDASQMLLTADLLKFGFEPDGSSGAPTFEFLGSVTGGSLASDFHGIGAPVGVKLHGASSLFAGDMTQNYSNNGGSSNTFSALPEPGTLTLLAGGVASLAGMVWRRNRRSPATAE
jgi:hypothetical protein